MLFPNKSGVKFTFETGFFFGPRGRVGEGDFGTQVQRFIDVNGDLPVAKVTKAHVRKFKDILLQLPARPPVNLRGKSVQEVIAATASMDLPRLSVQTVNDKGLGAIGAVFNYGVQNGYLEHNPATGIKAVGPKITKPPRLPYAASELQTIFNSPVFIEGERPHAGGGEAAKWLPLLALWTGARIEELGRLEVADVGQENGVDFIHIHGEGEGRSIKNAGSRRKVPLHPELIRLGFLEYVGARRKAHDVMVFPALASKRAQITAAFSTWWRRYTSTLGITDSTKVFHSFRHTFKRGMREARVPAELSDALQGHAVRNVADQYGRDEEGSGFSLPALLEAISALQYPGLRLDNIK